MDDTDTGSIELNRAEANDVVGALSEYQATASGRDEERALNVRQLLEREFGFDDEHFDDADEAGSGRLAVTGQSGWLFGEGGVLSGSDDEHEIQLSRAEAVEVDSALADFRDDSDPEGAERLTNLRRRFAETFDLDAGDPA